MSKDLLYQSVILRRIATSGPDSSLGLDLQEVRGIPYAVAVGKTVARPDTLAANAGVFSDGDLLVHLNGKSLKNREYRDVITELKGLKYYHFGFVKGGAKNPRIVDEAIADHELAKHQGVPPRPMAGTLDKEKEGSRGSYQKRYFVLHDGWLVYYHAENQVDPAREESFSVDADVRYRTSPDGDALAPGAKVPCGTAHAHPTARPFNLTEAAQLVDRSANLKGYRCAGAGGVTFVKASGGYVPMEDPDSGTILLRATSEESFLVLEQGVPVCKSADVTDLDTAMMEACELSQGDIVVGKKNGATPFVKTSQLSQVRYVATEANGRQMLRSLGKAPGGQGTAFQLISMSSNAAARTLDIRCMSRETAVPRLLTMRAESDVAFDAWERSLQEHILFSNEVCTEAEFRVRKMAAEISKRSMVLSVLKTKLFDNGDREILVKCVLRWVMRAGQGHDLERLESECRNYKAKLHEASSAAAELITQYGASLGLVHSPEAEMSRVKLSEFCYGFSLTQSALIAQVFMSFDVEGDGSVRYDDFSRLLENYSVLDYDGRVAWIFRLWDTKHEGRLSAKQVMLALKSAAASETALQNMYRKVEQEYAEIVPHATMTEVGVDLQTFRGLARKFGTALVYPAASVMDCIITHTYSDPDSVTRGFLGAWRRPAASRRTPGASSVKTELAQARNETLSGCVGLGWFFQ